MVTTWKTRSVLVKPELQHTGWQISRRMLVPLARSSFALPGDVLLLRVVRIETHDFRTRRRLQSVSLANGSDRDVPISEMSKSEQKFHFERVQNQFPVTGSTLGRAGSHGLERVRLAPFELAPPGQYLR
jgi:hypothetical protein